MRDGGREGRREEAFGIRMSGIEKSFGAVPANRGASLEVRQGEIHALVGENGAGKSTLMRILAGLYPPDAGTVEVAGKDVTGWSTASAIAAGVGMVHQHFMLVPTLTVSENVVLGREPRRGMGGIAIDNERATRDVQEIAEKFGLRIEPDRLIRDLSVGEAQRVEILKVLFRGAEILILDEPTAVLSPPEVKELWQVLRRLRDDGGTIVLITHKLDEVLDVSDRITVMRAGQTVAQMSIEGTTPADIARAMVGRDVVLMGESSAEKAPASATEAGPVVVVVVVENLVVAGSNRPRAVDNVSFTIEAGEILGIAGVEGNGQTELIEAIAGLRAAKSGRVRLGSRDVTTLDVRERVDSGLAHIPEDRHRRGLILDYSLADNLILGAQHRFTRGLQLDNDRIQSNAKNQIERFDVRPADATLPARTLSGGNQQKVVIAREMGSGYTVLLASQPTRGVDVGAIEFIHAELRAARAAGKAILLVSAELTEILALSDRVAVMYNGRIVKVLPRSEASVEVLGPLMTGAHDASKSAA